LHFEKRVVYESVKTQTSIRAGVTEHALRDFPAFYASPSAPPRGAATPSDEAIVIPEADSETFRFDPGMCAESAFCEGTLE
jgi:hypothetical protein